MTGGTLDMFHEIITNIGGFLAGTQVQIMYWAIAIFGTAVFSLFAVLTFFGFGGPHDVDVSADGSFDSGHMDTGYGDFKLISIRSVLAFLTVFGWAGVIWGRLGWVGFLIAVGCGFVMMVIAAFLFYSFFRLQHSGNVNTKDYIGKTGTVYITIPGGRAESGKVTVSLEGSTREIIAVADEEIKTGTVVLVAESIDERRFLVKKLG